jgi:phage tail-like protein
MVLSAVSSGTAAVKSLSGGTLGSYPNYGLSMRFEVQVQSLSLGHWHSCRGLSMKFEYKSIDDGGEYTQRSRVPERITYSAITLERAVLEKESKQLQQWLALFVDDWEEYPNNRERGPLVKWADITLLDYQLAPVMTWRLEDVFPASWSGPSLSANDNKVAIETLVLEHEGITLSNGVTV